MNFKGLSSIAFITSEAATIAGAFSYPRLPYATSRQTTIARHVEIRPDEDTKKGMVGALRSSESFGFTSNEVDVHRNYYDRIRSLSSLLEETNSNLGKMKQLVLQVKAIELKHPSLARIPVDNPGGSGAQLKVALADAKAAMEVYGPSSPEAERAWAVIDICFETNEDGMLELKEESDVEANSASSSYRYSAAALEAHHAYDAVIDTALLEESVEALGTIEGLAKCVGLEKQRLGSGESSSSVGP